MNSFKKPDDRRPTARDMFNNALKLQASNMAQKTTLDLIGGKLIMILGVLNKPATQVENHEYRLHQIKEITGMTREQVAERRSAKAFAYPDVEIQAVLNRAADEIAALLTPKDNG